VFNVSGILVQAQRIAAVDPAVALDLCERIADFAEEREDYHVLRGQLEIALGNPAQAWQCINRALALGSQDPAAFLMLGALARSRSTPDHVRRLYQRAAVLDPALAPVYSNLANLELDGDSARAEDFAGRALRLSPNFPEALINAGVLSERRGDYDMAYRHFRAALADNPYFTPALINLGTLKQRQGLRAEAREMFSRTLVLDPADPTTLNALGVAALSESDTASAERWFNHAVATDPTFSEALFNLASLLQESGDINGALPLYGRIKDGPLHAASLYNAGIALTSDKRFREAADLLRQAATAAPSDPDIVNQLAKALIDLKDLPGAKRALSTAIAIIPDKPEYYYNFGLIEMGQENAEAAIKNYNRSISLGLSDSALAFCGIGIANIEAVKANAGIRALRIALALSPDLAMGYSNLGIGYQNIGKHDDALANYMRAVQCAPMDGTVALNVGIALLKGGDHVRAKARLRIALLHDPDGEITLFSVGNALLAAGEPEAASTFFRRSITVDRTYRLGWNNLAIALQRSGRDDEADECFARLLAENPDYAHGHYNYALLCQKLGRLADAERCYRLAIQHDPDLACAYNNLGLLLRQCGRIEEGLACLEQAAKSATLHNNLGNLYQKQGSNQEALTHYREAIRLEPNHALAHYNLGTTLLEMGDYEGSKPHLRTALELAPDHVSCRYNLACALQHSHANREAATLYQEVVRRDPNHYRAMTNLASTLQSLGQVEEALELYGRAQSIAKALGVQAEPDNRLYGADVERLDDAAGQLEAKEDRILGGPGPLQEANPSDMYTAAVWNKSLLLLAMGRLEEGWENYEYRWRALTGQRHRPFRQPKWDGKQDLAGKRILIWHEQGIGDEIMFSSCLPDLARLGAEITFECSPKLRPLFQRSFPTVRVVNVDARNDATRNDFDIHLPVGSLPRFFRRNLSDFPTRNSFLVPDPARVAYWRTRLEGCGPGPYIGMCWRSKVQTLSRSPNYTRIEEWEPLFRTPGITLVNLQYDDATEELARVQAMFGRTIHSFPDIDMWDNLDDVAALIKALDLLISVGTSVQMLGGGVGAPTWLLAVLNIGWPHLGTDHWPWYPSVRLFSKALDQSWQSTMEQMRDELANLFPTPGADRH